MFSVGVADRLDSIDRLELGATSMETAVVSELWRFPVKSMGGERVDRLLLDRDGVVGDRRFAVRDRETGLIASAKRPGRWGVLLTCRATTSPIGETRVTLPDGTAHPAGDPGLDAALSELTGREVVLEHVDELANDASVDYEAEYPELEHVRLRGRMAFPAAMITDARSYVDLSAVHLMTTSSIAKVAEISTSATVDSRRFRPNIVVDTGPRPAFTEDAWEGSPIGIGPDVVLGGVLRAPRCVMTSVEQPELPRDNRILQSIARENRIETPGHGPLPCTGIFAEVARAGTVSIGDALTIGVGDTAGSTIADA